jgi:hypothetical protein
VVLNVVLGWLSLQKQRFYCNGNKYVFCKSAEALADMPDPGPRIECRCEIIRDFAELERQACCPEIVGRVFSDVFGKNQHLKGMINRPLTVVIHCTLSVGIAGMQVKKAFLV